jgi:hypothetical protein
MEIFNATLVSIILASEKRTLQKYNLRITYFKFMYPFKLASVSKDIFNSIRDQIKSYNIARLNVICVTVSGVMKKYLNNQI